MNDALPPDHGHWGAALHDAVADVSGTPDVADVRRRLGARRRRLGTGVAVLATVAVASTVALWPDDGPQQVASRDDAAADSKRSPAAGAGGGAPVAAVAEDIARRTTSEGLVVTTTYDHGQLPGGAAYWDAPEACRSEPSITVNVQAADPAAQPQFGSTWASIPADDPESVFVTVQRVTPMFIVDDTTYETIPVGGSGVAVTVPDASTITVVGGGPAVGTSGQPTSATPAPGSIVDVVTVVGAHVRAATARFGTGTSDAAEAARSTVALAARVPDGTGNDLSNRSTTVTVTLDDGKELELGPIDATPSVEGTVTSTYDLTGRQRPSSLDPTTITTVPDAQCTPPPPPMPAPGEQPADPDARDAVIAAMQTFMDGSKTPEEHGTALVDPSFGERMTAELDDAYAAVASTAKVSVDDVVFTSPTEAVVRFDVDLQPTGAEPLPIPDGIFHDKFGTVVLRDGRWLVTSETLCSITSVATPNTCSSVDTSAFPAAVYGPEGTANQRVTTTTR